MDNLHDDFLDKSELNDLDERILNNAGSSDLVDRMQERKQEEAAKRWDWIGDLQRHKFSYALLALSFLFTEMLAIYLGLAPEKRADPNGNSYIFFHTDFVHLATMLVYMLVFPSVTEVAFAVARNKFNERETGNIAQSVSMFVAMAFSVIAIVGTGVAGGWVVLSTLGFLSKFVTIPDSVQTWIVWIIPLSIAFYSILYTVYELSSKHERAKRFVKEQERTELLNHQLRQQEIVLAGRRKMQAASIRLYERMVLDGLLSQSEADEAIRSGISLAELEKKLRRDLTGEGKIGDTSGLSRPPRAQLPAPDEPTPARKARQYTVEEWLKFADMSREEAFTMFQGIDFETASKAWNRLFMDYGMIPPGMTFSNFKEIYHKVIVEDFPGKARFQNYGPAGEPGRRPASQANWDEVNNRLEEVKQDILRAKRILDQEPSYHPVSLDPKDRKNGQNP